MVRLPYVPLIVPALKSIGAVSVPLVSKRPSLSGSMSSVTLPVSVPPMIVVSLAPWMVITTSCVVLSTVVTVSLSVSV